MKKNHFLLKAFFMAVMIFTVVGCNTKNTAIDENGLRVIVYDKDNESIYDKKDTTTEKYLIDALKNFKDLNLETETGDYGEYVVGINGLSQGDNYYWNYYVNDNYASVGISNYEIKDNDVITFKLEKFE